jgi:hypothetical protein
MPGVQKPHCRPWHSLKAACIGCMVPSGCAMPSMVVIFAPLTCAGSTLHDLIARPLTMDGAGAALSGVAAHVGAGQLEMLAQRLYEKGVGGRVDRDRAAVDRE